MLLQTVNTLKSPVRNEPDQRFVAVLVTIVIIILYLFFTYSACEKEENTFSYFLFLFLLERLWLQGRRGRNFGCIPSTREEDNKGIFFHHLVA